MWSSRRAVFNAVALRAPPVEHAVDVLVAVGAAEALGQLDGLVDRHLVRHVHAVLQLVDADHQHAVLDRRKLGGPAVDVLREHRVDRRGLRDAAVQQRIEVHRVAVGEALLLAHVRVDDARFGAAEQPLVQALQRGLARAPASRGRTLAGRFGALLCRSFSHERSSIRLAISTATRAASRPFSSARAQAWASFSTVRMALAIGIWWSSETRVTPAPLSLATSSKW
jgi:hypothetical protein